jgi:hypothetical protein
MSAFLSFPFADRIELLADGATCLPSGAFIKATDKITASPYVPLAVTGRGQHGDLRKLTEIIIRLSACGSVDDTIDAIAGSLDDVRDDPGEQPAHNFEIVIAAFSETRGPCHYMFSSFEGEGRPAWTLLDWSGEVIGGGPTFTEADIAATGLNAESFADGAAAPGLVLMEHMRRQPGSDWTNPNGVHAYWIGGHVDHAVISAEGVTITRIREWQDQPFRPIDPNA